jgi:hypothetical protein
MRVTNRILKCTVFIGREEKDGRFTPLGTGFLVSTNYMDYRPPLSFQYVVTCAHVVQGNEKRIVIRANDKVTGARLTQAPRGWFYHPDPKRYVDVSVAPVLLNPQMFDISAIPIDTFCTQAILDQRDVGVGDELFYPGMFVSHHGKTANMPVMRLGTVAAMADQTDLVVSQSGALTKVHLIESRSIGGHSGSPVFVNFMAPRTYYADKKITLPHPLEAQAYRLFGMLRSHLNATDSGEYTAENRPGKDWVNSGIASVVPADDIAETIKQEELEIMRKKDLADHMTASGETSDSAEGTKSAPSS